MVIAPDGYPHQNRYPGGNVSEADAHPLIGLAAQIRNSQIQALLTGRRSDLLTDPEHADLLREIKRGVAAEVSQLLDADGNGVPSAPTAGIPLDLALWTIALGVAANIESSLFPEQQLGDDSRSQQLQARYLGVRKQLIALVAAAGGSSDPDSPVGYVSGVVHVGYGGWDGW